MPPVYYPVRTRHEAGRVRHRLWTRTLPEFVLRRRALRMEARGSHSTLPWTMPVPSQSSMTAAAPRSTSSARTPPRPMNGMPTAGTAPRLSKYLPARKPRPLFPRCTPESPACCSPAAPTPRAHRSSHSATPAAPPTSTATATSAPTPILKPSSPASPAHTPARALPCTSTADFNGDGDTGTDADIEAFFRVLAGGSC